MPTYRVKDNETGREIDFEWNDPNPPTDEDLESIFKEASELVSSSQPQFEQAHATNVAPLPENEKFNLGREIVRTAEPIYRPGLEIGGMVVGGAMATPETGGLGTIPGAALGYAGGRQLANRIDEYAGIRERKPIVLELLDTGKDVATGATMEVGGKVVGKGLEAAGNYMKEGAKRSYISALKPSKKVSLETQDRIADVGLGNTGEGFIGITPKGISKLNEKIDDVNEEISQLIRDNPKRIKTGDIIKRVKRTLDWARNAPNSQEVLGEIFDYVDGVAKSKGETMSSVDVQEMKKFIYSRLKNAYGELKTFQKEVDKDIARGAKEELVKIYPQLQSLNARDSDLINLDKVLVDAVKRIGKRDVIGLTEGIAGVTGAAVMGGPGAVKATLITKIIKSPSIQARVAFLVNKASAIPIMAKNVSPIAGYEMGKKIPSIPDPLMKSFLGGKRGKDYSRKSDYPANFDLSNSSTWPKDFGTDMDIANAEQVFGVPEERRTYGDPISSPRRADYSKRESYPANFDLYDSSTWPKDFGTDMDIANAERVFNIPEEERTYGDPVKLKRLVTGMRKKK